MGVQKTGNAIEKSFQSVYHKKWVSTMGETESECKRMTKPQYKMLGKQQM